MPVGVKTVSAALLALAFGAGCSVKKYAVNQIGELLSSGDSIYETEEDIVLVREALPFSLKLVETLLTESPNHRGLLLAACRGFVLYSYAYVDYEAEVLADEDLDLARTLRERARRLYLRGLGYGIRALEQSYPGFGDMLSRSPEDAAGSTDQDDRERDLPLLYWTAASLGLAISVSKNDAAMLAKLPEVEAILDRALELDESWNQGALHEFKLTVAASQPGRMDTDRMESHYQRALDLSRGRRASLYLAYAEAHSVPMQNRNEFRSLLETALDIDPDAEPSYRLMNLLAQRRAEWLLSRIDELFLDEEVASLPEGASR
ncbi:MAG TPA: TRAP transporter TatT component family protein [Vicinamibacteria bacterium]|jgi:predicted anti-sigma-YlaC factor YlaD